ncbi:MAG: hypothetical protein ACR2PL_15670, partial [Dehalococcoidia bacterium]
MVGDAMPALLAVIFMAPALRFLAQPGFPLSDDGLNHVLQIASFVQSIDQGDLYPRWSPLLNQQYGSPIFSYYAPLPFYLAELGRLAQLSLTDSLKGVFAASILLSCLAMYLLGRQLAGRAVGFASGVTYGLLPYLLHDVYSRSELGEALGLALLPAILFGFTRYAHTRRPVWLAVGSIGVASLFLTHSISVVMYLPFVALWSVLLAFADVSGLPSWHARIRLTAQLLAGVALGTGLAAFFWLPAFAEKSYVQLQRTVSRDVLHGYLVPRFWPPIEGSWLFDYRYNL